jgi:hypothetical protein
MSDISTESVAAEVRAMRDRLRTERDELAVKTHLARAEIRDEWRALEQRWHEFERRAQVAGSEARQAGADVGAALKLLGEELAQAFQRIRKAL